MPTKKDLADRDRKKLLDERERLFGALERLREALKVEVDVDTEEGDPDLVEREKNVALVKQLERKVEDVEIALRAVDKGKYGICERCGIAINPERLEIRPDATMCVQCQSDMEKLIRRGQLPRSGQR